MNLQVSEDWEATEWEARNLGGYQRKTVPEFSTGIATPQKPTSEKSLRTRTSRSQMSERTTRRANNLRSQKTEERSTSLQQTGPSTG